MKKIGIFRDVERIPTPGRIKRKILYVCHGHPQVMPGGAEGYALELYHGMRRSGQFEPMFVARHGPPTAGAHWIHPGTPWSAVNGDSHQYFFYTDGFDWFYQSLNNKEFYTRYFDDFLRAHKPDLVHLQHTAHFGFDLIRQIKNALPTAPIVYTLHEYLPICHRNGQMLRTKNDERCLEASPRRCHECFPEISPQAFFLRKRFIQSHLSLVDMFLAPSRFLLERYVDWGIPREKIRFEENGREEVQRASQSNEPRPRNRLGFFGQFNHYKGINVLLKAMEALRRSDAPTLSRSSSGFGAFADTKIVAGTDRPSADGDIHLWVHGANLDLQPKDFQQEFRSLLEQTKRNVTLVGRYDPAELPKLMANVDWVIVPSIWWENAPLVIQEAFVHGRPVICSDIGGMAEKVTDGVNGLHFRAGDPLSLVATIRRAVGSDGLWERLSGGIPNTHTVDDHVDTLSRLYASLLDQRAQQPDIYAH